MSRKAGVVTINLQAGTAAFIQDMEKADAKMRDFGNHSVTSVQAASAAIRTLEGGLPIRAVERFTVSVLGMGPLLEKAFPIVGAVVFAGVIAETGKKVYEFFKSVQEAPERIGGAFRELNAPLRLTNDELQVANERLKNDIAVLEGQRKNTLQLALFEARVEADKLADSLDRDLAALNKVLKENTHGFFGSRIRGEIETDDIRKELGGETGFGGFRGRIAGINDEGNAKIRAAKDQKALDAARADRDAKLAKEYGDEIAQFSKQLAEAQRHQAVRVDEMRRGMPSFIGVGQTTRIEDLTRAIQNLREEASVIPFSTEGSQLKARKESDEAARANAQQDRPFEERMKMLGAQIDAVKAKLEAIGKPEAAQVIAKAFGEAQKAIVETNRALERHNTHLSEAQKGQILAAERTIVSAEAEAEWRTRLVAANTSIADRIKSQELLTAAIGKGYEATRAANVETRLMQELGQHANDPAWMTAHSGDIAGLRSAYQREFDAQNAEQSARATDRLRDEIELEQALAAVQARGAEAVREAALAVQLRQLAEKGATKEQIQAEIELFNARQANATAADVAKINERIEATHRLTDAILGGAEAERRAALENKYAEVRRTGDEAIPGVVGIGQKELAERTADAAERQRQITAEALRTGLEYQNQIELIDQQIAALEKLKQERGDILAIELSLRDLENQRLKALAEESLRLRGLRDGVRAFFLDMQRDAKSAAEIVYESLHSALDRVSSHLAKLFTGQKTNWSAAFKELGEQMVESTVKSQLQKGLAALGKHLGIDLGGAKPDGTQRNPIWVRMAGSAGSGIGIPGAGGGGRGPLDGDYGGDYGKGGPLDGVFGEGSKGGGIFSFLRGLLGKGDGGGTGSELVTSAIDFGGFYASGGSVDPGHAYVVGERGAEMFVPSSAGRIVPNGELGGSTTAIYHIDARGADLGAQNRIARGIEASHRAAVSTAVQATHERSRRVPAK